MIPSNRIYQITICNKPYRLRCQRICPPLCMNELSSYLRIIPDTELQTYEKMKRRRKLKKPLTPQKVKWFTVSKSNNSTGQGIVSLNYVYLVRVNLRCLCKRSLIYLTVHRWLHWLMLYLLFFRKGITGFALSLYNHTIQTVWINLPWFRIAWQPHIYSSNVELGEKVLS